MVANDQVMIHPMLPWSSDTRFALSSAKVTARGCSLWHSKSSTHHQIIFKVRDNASGQEIDVGEAAGRSIPVWLQVLHDYASGQLSLPAVANAPAPHDDDCMHYWLTGLNAQQQAELSQLLS